MKITRLVHSCLRVETDDKTVLVDPGQFSWESGLIDESIVSNIDQIVVTHEHFDHFYLPFTEQVVQNNPDVRIVMTSQVCKQLAEADIKATSDSTQGIEIFSRARHASLSPLGEAPENIAVHIADRLTVGGDRHDLETSKEILALPVTAPWGSMMSAADMALKLKPRHIVPIHDWHWNEKARQQAYDRLRAFFSEHNIQFHEIIDGQAIEIA